MGSITLFNYLRIFDGYFLLKIFENILPRTRDEYSHKKENFFLFNMNSNHKEVMVMVEIVLSVSEEKQKKKQEKILGEATPSHSTNTSVSLFLSRVDLFKNIFNCIL